MGSLHVGHLGMEKKIGKQRPADIMESQDEYQNHAPTVRLMNREKKATRPVSRTCQTWRASSGLCRRVYAG